MPNWNLQSARGEMRSGTGGCGFHRRPAPPEEHGTDPLLAEAIRRTKDGDADALTFLYVRYADNVYSYVRSIVRDEHEAEDITQNLFSRLPSSLARYEPRSVPFLAWILRVARNLALDHLRAVRSVPCAEVRGSDETADEAAGDRSLVIHQALDALPADQREVLILRHVLGMTPTEIACALAKTEASIHGLHHRGRRAMQHELIELESRPVTAGACSG